MFHECLLDVPYDFEAGPVSPLKLMYGVEEINRMNCQRALQLFYYFHFGMTLNLLECLSAEGYETSGKTVTDAKDCQKFFSTLQFGDVVYSLSSLSCERGIILGLSALQKLHIAVFLGQLTFDINEKYLPKDFCSSDRLIYHTTPIAGKSEICTVKQFCKNYRPVRGKRILE